MITARALQREVDRYVEAWTPLPAVRQSRVSVGFCRRHGLWAPRIHLFAAPHQGFRLQEAASLEAPGAFVYTSRGYLFAETFLAGERFWRRGVVTADREVAIWRSTGNYHALLLDYSGSLVPQQRILR